MMTRLFGSKIGFSAVVLLALSACADAPSDIPPPPPGLPGTAAAQGVPAGHPPMPGDHPAPGASNPTHPTRSAAPARLDVPDSVKKTWKSVNLTVTVGGKSRQAQVPIGSELALNNDKLSLRVLAYLPAFQIGDGAITSLGNEPTNPAALLRLSDKDKIIAEGWVFQALPDFDSFKTDRVSIRLLSANR